VRRYSPIRVTSTWTFISMFSGDGLHFMSPSVVLAFASRELGDGKVLYLFGDYALDTARRELRREGDLLAIEPKVFDLLLHLIANRERVVSKDGLIEAVWNGRIVSDSTLTSRINAARSAIGDSGEAQRVIKTLPRKGVRFVATVRQENNRTELTAADIPPPPGLILPGKPSVAVLPFTNMSSDPEQDYFADGMVEEIITALSQMRWLFVIARNSTSTYKGRDVDVKQVGRELGVRYVLEGSVRRSGSGCALRANSLKHPQEYISGPTALRVRPRTCLTYRIA